MLIRTLLFCPLRKDPRPPTFHDVCEQDLSWTDVEWLRSITQLPIVLKGIQTGEDAAIACNSGVAAIAVSNHGPRLPAARATIDALPEVVDAVAGRLEVLVDGSVRSGGDVLKASALRAKAVLIGRACTRDWRPGPSGPRAHDPRCRARLCARPVRPPLGQGSWPRPHRRCKAVKVIVASARVLLCLMANVHGDEAAPAVHNDARAA